MRHVSDLVAVLGNGRVCFERRNVRARDGQGLFGPQDLHIVLAGGELYPLPQRSELLLRSLH